MAQPAGLKAELARGWPALAGGAIGMGAGIAMFGAVSGLFIKPLQEEFGWGRGEIAMSSAAVFVLSLTLPLVGMLVDRHGPRLFVAVGAVAFAACYAALASMPNALWVYFSILAVIGLVAGPATAPVVFTQPIVAAFASGRGLALAIGMSGSALVSILMVPTLQQVIAHAGWRAGYWTMAPLALGLGLLSFLFLSRARAASPEATPAAPAPPREGASLAQAMRDARFWLLGLAMVTANMAGGAIAAHMQPLLSDAGMPGATAALLGSYYAAAVVAGRFLCGALLDRFWPPAVAALALSAPVAGLLLLSVGAGELAVAAIAVTFIALAQGAEGDILAFFTARYFGLKHFGIVFGVLALAFGVSVAIGAVGAGYMFDHFGSYGPTLSIGALLAAIAAIAIFASGLRGGVAGVARQTP